MNVFVLMQFSVFFREIAAKIVDCVSSIFVVGTNIIFGHGIGAPLKKLACVVKKQLIKMLD